MHDMVEAYLEFRWEVCWCGKPGIVELRSQDNTSDSRVIALSWTSRIILSSPICITAVLLDILVPFDQ